MDKKKESAQTNLFYKMQKIDYRIIYVLIVLVLVLPLIFPPNLPILMKPYTITAYNMVNSLREKPGSVIFFEWDGHPVNYAELGLSGRALMYHAFRLPVKIIFFSLWAEGLVFFDTAVQQTIPSDRQYGRDYVFLGFLAGGEVAASKIADDFHSVFYTDYMGRILDQIPGAEWLKDIKGAKDAPMLISLPYMGSRQWLINQWQSRYKTPWVLCDQLSQLQNDVVLLNSGIIQGFLSGVRGAAEYDKLQGRQSVAASQLDCQTMACFLTFILVIIANIGYFGARIKKREVKYTVSR